MMQQLAPAGAGKGREEKEIVNFATRRMSF
jgi:hypothetical protein